MISNQLKNLWQNAQKKVISKNVTEIFTFFTFTHVRQTCFVYNFLCVHFLTTFSTDSKSAWNSAFDIYFLIKKKHFFWYISTFWKLWSQMRKKRLKKSKNVFCKCVLDFNFAPIKGSVFFILKKSQIRCTLLCIEQKGKFIEVNYDDKNLKDCDSSLVE